MTELLQTYLRSLQTGVGDVLRLIRRRGPDQAGFWFIALLVGIASGLVALGFRLAISWLQNTFYGADDFLLATQAEMLPVWLVLGLPILGGLAVGLILTRYTPDGRVRSVADVIEGAALNAGRVEKRAGLASALASLITLSTGGSSGREGPVVHLAAVISSWVSDRIRANGITGRDLLGCAVAAAVSASFNAPIAGALFALEVILRHFAIHAFAPIVIASVAGTLVSRLAFGNVTEFMLPVDGALRFYAELPAFLLLGLICGVVAITLIKSIFIADEMADRFFRETRLPAWSRPAIAGLVLGSLALEFPHIIGVGYETTSRALTGSLIFHEAVVFAVLKVIALAVTMGGRMGGGVFSPSLMVGALTGLAFGHVATGLFPDVSGAETLYALAGMGAVAAAVLGAPISTTLIVFELTGDWQTGLAVMVAVSMSTALTSKFIDHSFFLSLLERRNVHLAAGPHAYLLTLQKVAEVMRDKTAENAAPEEACWDMISNGIYIDGNATLEAAMPLFDAHNMDFVPVVTVAGEGEPAELWGALFQVDALKAFNKALAETAEEEHS